MALPLKHTVSYGRCDKKNLHDGYCYSLIKRTIVGVFIESKFLHVMVQNMI